jgi:cyclophilin family peptidyl-prolyl cis-trans isomerase
MLSKALFMLPFAAFALAAAKAPPPPAEPEMPSFAAPADVAANPANRLSLTLSNGGTVVIQLRPDIAPKHVERIQTLVRQGFYNGLTFHRVIPGFMAQGGDPKGTGEGGSSLPELKAEFTAMPFLRGTVAAARTGDNVDSANSQFFIMFVPNAELNGNYTVFGRVISGMDTVDKIAPGEPPPEPTKIVSATLGDATAATAAK